MLWLVEGSGYPLGVYPILFAVLILVGLVLGAILTKFINRSLRKEKSPNP